jgi:predicted DNA-binding ribbon-helix-helix protein
MSPVKKRSVYVGRRNTSITLEDEFWDGLHEVARARGVTMTDFITNLPQTGNISSAIRCAVLAHYRGPRTARTE